jgi:hypothetical protein
VVVPAVSSSRSRPRVRTAVIHAPEPESPLRLPLVLTFLATTSLACGGLGDAAKEATTAGASAATAPPPPPTTLTIPPFTPLVGQRFAATTDMAMDLQVTSNGQPVRVQATTHYAGDVTVRSVANGRVETVTVRVTDGKTSTTTPDGVRDALPDSVGKEYMVTRVDNGENRVERTDGGRLGGDEADAPRRLAGTLFSERTTPLAVEGGRSIDATALLGAPEEGQTMSGTMTLGAPDASCAAPFAGSLAGTSVTGGATVALSMTGNVCVDPSSGLVTMSDLQGNADTGAQGKGTVRIGATVRRQ